MLWKREKIFCVTGSFKTVSKPMQLIDMIMIYYWEKKLKKNDCMSWKLI